MYTLVILMSSSSMMQIRSQIICLLWPNAGSILGHRLRRWSHIEPALDAHGVIWWLVYSTQSTGDTMPWTWLSWKVLKHELWQYIRYCLRLLSHFRRKHPWLRVSIIQRMNTCIVNTDLYRDTYGTRVVSNQIDSHCIMYDKLLTT